MLDYKVRKVLDPKLDRVGKFFAHLGIPADFVTLLGWLFGVAAIIFVSQRFFWLSLIFWLINRVLDGLDGPIARSGNRSPIGGLLDLLADFSIYGGYLVGLAIAMPSQGVALAVLFLSYYLSGMTLMAISSMKSESKAKTPGKRTFYFANGLAEGTETIIAYSLICIIPWAANIILWVFSVMVFITFLQRAVIAMKLSKIRE